MSSPRRGSWYNNHGGSVFLRLASLPFLPQILWLFGGLAFSGLVLLLVWNGKYGIPLYSDYSSFHATALAWEKGMSLYTPFIYSPALQDMVIPDNPPPIHNANLNNPLFTRFVYPFSLLGTQYSYHAWILVQLFMGFLMVYLLARRTLPASPLLLPGLLLIFSVWFPVFANLLIGQVGIFLFALLAGAWLALDRKREALAGLLLGLALLLKPFVGLIFVWLLLCRRWRVIAYGTGAWLGGVGLALMVFGVGDILIWVEKMSSADNTSLSWNASLEGLLTRYFGGGFWEGVVDWPWARWAIRSTAWMVSAWVLIRLSRLPNTFDTGFALALPLMLFLSPLGWIYYFPVLLVSAAILIREGTDPRPVALAFILAGVPQLLAKGDKLVPELWRFHPYGGHWELIDDKPAYVFEGGYHWFVLPEVYPLAIGMLCLIALRHGMEKGRNNQPQAREKESSAQTGA